MKVSFHRSVIHAILGDEIEINSQFWLDSAYSVFQDCKEWIPIFVELRKEE